MDPVVILGTDRIAVGPGEQARLPVRIRNPSRRVESYRVDIVGEAAPFARVEPPTVSVLPGREGELSVLFNPPGGARAPSGAVPFAVRATSEVEASYSAAAEGVLELAGVTGLQMWAANNAASGRWSGRYVLEFSNQGNAPTRLALSGRDPAAALKVTVEQELIELSPGGRTSTGLKAKARHPFLRGTPQNRIIEVRGRKVPFGVLPPEASGAPDPADPDQRTLQLTFQQKPVLSKLMLLGIVLAGALLLAFVVLRLRQADELVLDLAAPDAPVGFAAQASGSTAITLRWEAVPNALGYQILSATNTGELGDEVGAVEATARTFVHEPLEPGAERCYALIALGPEGAGNSEPTGHACATTALPSALEPPAGLAAAPEGAGAFTLTWTYPDTAGVEFTVVVDGALRPERIVGLTTRLVLEPAEIAREAVVAVEAVRGDEFSDPSVPVTVTVEALAATTTVATTVPGGGTTIGPPPPPPPPGGGTSTTVPPTSTTVAPAAATVLQDIAATPAAFLGPYRPQSDGGVPLEQRRNQLALAFNVPVSDIGMFSNRDTRVRDAPASVGNLANVTASTTFFFVSRPTADEAAAICTSQSSGNTCAPVTVQGAASAAEGTAVAVVGRLPAATTSVDDVDTRLDQLRGELDTQSVFALDGGEFQGFSPNEIVLYVSDLGTPQQVDQFCAQRPSGTCSRGTLTRLP